MLFDMRRTQRRRSNPESTVRKPLLKYVLIAETFDGPVRIAEFAAQGDANYIAKKMVDLTGQVHTVQQKRRGKTSKIVFVAR